MELKTFYLNEFLASSLQSSDNTHDIYIEFAFTFLYASDDRVKRERINRSIGSIE
jgi:hypothetical protein